MSWPFDLPLDWPDAPDEPSDTATLYFCALPSATTPTWSRANIGTNSGFSDTPPMHGTQASAPAAPQTDYEPAITWTGSLTAGTEYKLWAIWDDGTSSSNAGVPFGSAAFRTSYLLDTDPGSYALTGSDVALSVGRVLDVTPGSYSLTGSDVTLSAARSIDVTPGAYTLTGADVELTYGALTAYSLDIDSGFYAVTGQAVALSVTRVLDVTGSYAITGADVALTYGAAGAYTLDVSPGSYSISGADVGLTTGRSLDVDPGAYVLTGSAVNLARGYTLDIDPGAYTVTGFTVGLAITARAIDVAPGSYTLTGSDVDLKYSGAPVAAGGLAGGFDVFVEPQLWWQRKPKALSEEAAKKKLRKIARKIVETAEEQVEQATPKPQRRAQVVEAIRPMLEDMPGFDWQKLYEQAYTQALDNSIRSQFIEQARIMAAGEIDRIRRMDDEAMALILAVM